MANRTVRRELGRAAAKGAIAGIVGALAMKAVTEMEQRALLPEEQREPPPPKKVVQQIEEGQGVELSSEQEEAAAMGIHMGYSALWGALHGMGSEVMDIPPALHGLMLGGIVYFATAGPTGLLTKMGVTPSPMMQPMSKAAIPVGAHIAYGLTTAAVYETLH